MSEINNNYVELNNWKVELNNDLVEKSISNDLLEWYSIEWNVLNSMFTKFDSINDKINTCNEEFQLLVDNINEEDDISSLKIDLLNTQIKNYINELNCNRDKTIKLIENADVNSSLLDFVKWSPYWNLLKSASDRKKEINNIK